MDKQIPSYEFYKTNAKKVISEKGKDFLLDALDKMLLIRNFEIRAESAYQQGKVGGFFHAYIGQEAVQTAAVSAIGAENYWITTYRCHALALLLGVTPNEIMAELYGKITGNALGRGGSMHLYTDRLLGGFGIVGGHTPIAAGAAFKAKYMETGEVAVCFLGEGAVAQGAFHESLNLVSLWDLPCIYVVENNQWGMGTAVDRAISIHPIAEKLAPCYGMEGYTLDGMDFVHCYAAFKEISDKVKQTKRPVIIEVITERFRGHSISDPGLYRSKDALKKTMERDPIQLLLRVLKKENVLDDAGFDMRNKQASDLSIESMKFAEESLEPDLSTLEEDVFAP